MADSCSDRDPVEELAEGYLERVRRGENPALSEYTAAHPEHAEAIRELFPALVKIERLRPGADEAEELNHLVDPDSGDRIEQVGDFRIIREIGRGGMGAVYEAEQVSLGRRVALKVLIRRASRDRRTLERFRREARAAARLHHTNIVPVFEVGQDRGLVYYAMQFIEGQGLDRVIDELARLLPGEPSSPAIADLGFRARHSAPGSGANERAADQRAAAAPEAPQATGVVQSLLSGVFAASPLEVSTTPRRGNTSTVVVDSGEATLAGSTGTGLAKDATSPQAGDGPPANGPFPRPADALDSLARTGPAAAWPAPASGFASLTDRSPYYRSVAHIGRQIAQGLAYAHARGIVHRDVKPSNLLLDSAGVVWITDFGLAKAEDDGLTQTGDIVGTVRYMAPERFHGQADSRADVYSLGLTLYELLTLQPAFESSDRMQLMQQIQAADPMRPRTIDRHVPVDLETIVLKAIDKERARRYPQAEAMAEDLRRFLDDEPIRARPVRVWERVVKWARRRPGLAAMALVVQLLLASLLALGIWSYAQIDQALAVAEDQRGRALKALASESAARLSADRARAEEARTRAASDRLSADLALNRGLELAGSGQIARGLRWMARGLELAPKDDEGRRLRRAARANILAWSRRAIVPRAVLQAPAAVLGLAVRPSGETLVAGCDDGTIQFWELPSGRPLARFRAAEEAVDTVRFRSDGQAFLTYSVNRPDVRIWDANRHLPLVAPIHHPSQTLNGALFAPGGHVVATLGHSGIRLWDASSGRPLAGPWDQVNTNKAEFSPDARLLFTFGYDGMLQVWDLQSCRLHGPSIDMGNTVTAVAFLDGGRRFAVVVSSGLSIFETATLRKLAATPPAADRWNIVAFQPDRGFLAVGSGTATVQFFDAETARPIGQPLNHGDMIVGLAFSPDSRFLMTSELHGASRLFDARSQRLLDSVVQTVEKVIPVYAADGRTIVTAGGGRLVRVWDIAGVSDPVWTLPFATAVQTAQFSPDGGLVATASFDGTARLYDVATASPHGPPLEQSSRVRVARFSPDGRLLVTGGDDGLIQLWDVAIGRRVGRPLPHPHWVVNALFSADGKTLLVGCVEGKARLWDLTTFKPIGPVLLHPSQAQGHEIWALAFGLDDRLAITASLEGTIRFWDVATGAPVGETLRYRKEIRQMRVLNDGTTMVFLEGGQVHTFDLAIRRETRPPFGERQSVMTLGPDGRTLMTGGDDCTAQLWDLGTGKPIGPSLEHSHHIVGVAISPDAKILLTITFDGILTFWDAATGKPIGPALKHDGFTPVGRRDDRPPIAFEPSGRYAFSAGNTTCLWRVPALVDDPSRPSDDFAGSGGREFDNEDERRSLERDEWDKLRRLAGARETTDVPIDDDAWHDTQARQLQTEGLTGPALWHLDRLIAKHPSDWPLHARRSAVHAQRGDLDQAARDDAQARAIGPRAAVDAWRWHLSFNLLNDRRWQAALRFLDDSLPVLPDRTHPLFLRALALSHLGKLDEAVATLRQAVDHGFHDIDLLKTTEDFSSLRGRDDFQRLLAGPGDK
jgi:WD40 repeat protein